MSQRPFLPLIVACLLAAALVCGVGCPPSAPHGHSPGGGGGGAAKLSDEAAVRHLLGLMRDRLLLMNEVARTKWAFKRPISDPAREAALLQEMAERGQGIGLDPEETRHFFTAQIEAAKLIQQLHFDQWQMNRSGPLPETVTDLAELRRQIDDLNQQLLKALAEADPWLDKKTGWEELMHWSRQELTGPSIDDVVRAKALGPLTEKKSDLPPGF